MENRNIEDLEKLLINKLSDIYDVLKKGDVIEITAKKEGFSVYQKITKKIK